MSIIQVWAPAVGDSSLGAPAVAAPALGTPAVAAPALRLSELRAYEVDSSVLSSNLKKTLADFQQIMDYLPKSKSGYCVDEIELNMGFTGKGGIAFFGKLEVGVDAAIKVKIKREVVK
jgi:hypothetical protein